MEEDTIKDKDELILEPAEEEEWDFDFSVYEHEDKGEEIIESIKNLKRPNVTGVRSRFSNGHAELERLADINKLISAYAIKVAARTQDLHILWKFYGLLDEFWESMRNIYGQSVNNEIEDSKKECVNLLKKHENGEIPYSVHEKFLYLRGMIYRLKQLGNLGFEIDKIHNSSFFKAKRNITQ